MAFTAFPFDNTTEYTAANFGQIFAAINERGSVVGSEGSGVPQPGDRLVGGITENLVGAPPYPQGYNGAWSIGQAQQWIEYYCQQFIKHLDAGGNPVTNFNDLASVNDLPMWSWADIKAQLGINDWSRKKYRRFDDYTAATDEDGNAAADGQRAVASFLPLMGWMGVESQIVFGISDAPPLAPHQPTTPYKTVPPWGGGGWLYDDATYWWMIAPDAKGDWAGHDGRLSKRNDAGDWEYVDLAENARVRSNHWPAFRKKYYAKLGGTWQRVSPLVFEYSATASRWLPCPDVEATPDIIELEGYAEKGDIITPELLNTFWQCLKLLLWTKGDWTRDTIGGEVIRDDASLATAKAEAEAAITAGNYDGGNSTRVTYNQYWSSYYSSWYVVIRVHKFAPSVANMLSDIACDIDCYFRTESPDLFNAQGFDVADEAYRLQATISKPAGQTTASGDYVGDCSVPPNCQTDREVGWYSWGQFAVVKWQFEYV